MQNEKKNIKTIMEMQHRKNKKLNHREKQLMLSVKWKKKWLLNWVWEIYTTSHYISSPNYPFMIIQIPKHIKYIYFSKHEWSSANQLK
jgi:hypothetical protein